MKHAAFSLALVAALCSAQRARADVSSWVYVGGGASSLKQKDLKLRLDPSLAIETGLGTPATHPLVVGGMFKLKALFGDGADLALALRVASRGFVTGQFGLALDAGPYQRFWGAGSSGGEAALVLGAPWGITLSAGGSMGTNAAREYGATLGLDFARLTVYRLSGENWFPNPHPAFRPNE
ncbi:MAG TPA: hypothetical protein VNG33_03490 [Polyangiaceae bacterium]|nr:hypothetical protein [Polyangiaceae bacterium]